MSKFIHRLLLRVVALALGSGALWSISSLPVPASTDGGAGGVSTTISKSSPVAERASPAAPFLVRSSEPIASLDRLFNRAGQPTAKQWLGADAAYSIALGKDLDLWMFGDTFIGKENSHQLRMINNSAAVQRLNQSGEFPECFWKDMGSNGKSLIASKPRGTWLWPLDGIFYNGKLYEFFNVLRRKESSEPEFGFESIGQKLLRVKNPLDNPASWQCRLLSVDGPGLQFGNAVVADDQFLYAFNSGLNLGEGVYKHPLTLARLPLANLDAPNIDSWEFWCHEPSAGGSASKGVWNSSRSNLIVLFKDGAPELTVSHIPGLDGLFAIYFPAGFGADILMRHADRPEGPWSEPVLVYHCPIDLNKYFVYSAKAHPELSSREGEVIITYCVNKKSASVTDANSDQDARARHSKVEPEPLDYYFPHFVRVQLEKR